MGEDNVVEFKLTKKHIYRLALKEVNNLYMLSAGSNDPIVDVGSIRMFEEGYIDEPYRLDWERYCLEVIERLRNGK
jgi:hypothetical protein